MKANLLMRMAALSLLIIAALGFASCKSAPNNFTLEGTVAEGVSAARYIVYVWDYDDPSQPVALDTIEAGRSFCFAQTLDEPRSGMLQPILADGSKGQFCIETMFVPGETCEISIEGDGFGEFTLGGSRFYKDWEAAARFFEEETMKAIALEGAGDEAYFEAVADYNQKHKDEEGAILYQYMWQAGPTLDLSIADGIQDGRFRRYIEYRRSQYNQIE